MDPQQPKKPLESSKVHFIPDSDDSISSLPTFVTRPTCDALLDMKFWDITDSTPSMVRRKKQS